MFKVLHYTGLDTKGLQVKFNKVIGYLEQGDFKSAQVKKLKPGKYLRAKLDDSNRLLFAPLKYKETTCLVALEIIRNHEYDKSRFLRGVELNEDEIEYSGLNLPVIEGISQISNYHEKHLVHFLDKFMVFDEVQNEVLISRLPLILVGSAGSGKTSLMLEKLKLYTGRILYISLSSYLVQNTERLYFANNYINDTQEIDFLSFNEFLESIRISNTRELLINDFMLWFNRQTKPKFLVDGRKLFEEFRGVITGANSEKAYLTQEEYLNLGIKQSIFLESERSSVYSLFKQYLKFLKENNFHDSNILAVEYRDLINPSYDMVLVDEVQDFTNSQLSLVLASLINKNQFFLCGDANQIVHPNFFSWSKLKSYFYNQDLNSDVIRILNKNYRNTPEVVELANRVLKFKNYRFGSIDKESHALVQSTSTIHGIVNCIAENSNLAKELNKKTALSINYAVIVLHEKDKLLAANAFDSPLIFTIQEAKGLEYDNVILFNFISEDAKYLEIVKGVDSSYLNARFDYKRAKDKTDKDLEIYKFYINALYVAITRAVKNVYLVETNISHPLLKLLDINEIKTIDLAIEKSSLDDWQKEASKLARQGKLEQMESIENKILHFVKVPWEIIDNEAYRKLADKISSTLDKKTGIELVNYGLIYNDKKLLETLSFHKVKAAQNLPRASQILKDELFSEYAFKNTRSMLEKTRRYGVDYRNKYNLTPLMSAAFMLSLPHIEELLTLGANLELVDNRMRTALMVALSQVMQDQKIKQQFNLVYHQLCPIALFLQTNNRLLKIDPHKTEFFFLLLLMTLVFSYDRQGGKLVAFTVDAILSRLDGVDYNIVPESRRKRSYVSSVLARNEVNRDYSYNRHLFKRVKTGHYVLNPEMKIKYGDIYYPINQ